MTLIQAVVNRLGNAEPGSRELNVFAGVIIGDSVLLNCGIAALLQRLLYIELIISFLIGRHRTIMSSRNQRL